MRELFEVIMYNIGQVFLLPTLVLISLLFLYTCYELGRFTVTLWQRRHRSYTGPLLAWWLENSGATADELDVKAHRFLETGRIATRVAPMLGLVATMIPMGPALRSLSNGNLAQVSESLTIAFSAIIIALISASTTFWIVNVRRRWLAEELLEIETRRKESSDATAS